MVFLAPVVSQRADDGPLYRAWKQRRRNIRTLLYCALIKRENKIFLIYKVIKSGAVPKSPYMRRTLVINDFATAPF